MPTKSKPRFSSNQCDKDSLAVQIRVIGHVCEGVSVGSGRRCFSHLTVLNKDTDVQLKPDITCCCCFCCRHHFSFKRSK